MRNSVAIFHIFFLAVLALAFGGHAARAEENMRVVIYGDSLTSGYQLQPNELFSTRLDMKLREIGYTNVEVVSMSVPGQTTTSGAEGIEDVIAKHPDVVIIALGNNDAVRGVNTDLIYTNLLNILGKLQQQRIYPVVLGIKAPAVRGYAYGKQLDAVFERATSFYKVAYYPNILEGIADNPDFSLADSYHPNGRGVDIIIENIYLLVDTGLRWRWQVISEQRGGYRPAIPEQALPPAMPPTAEPQATPPAAP